MIALLILGLAWGCWLAWRGHGGQLDPQDPIGDWDEVLAEVNTIPDRASLEREIRLWTGRRARARRRWGQYQLSTGAAWYVADVMVRQLRALRPCYGAAS